MTVSYTEPIVLLAMAMATSGVVMLVQARMQSRMLRTRIAAGEGTQTVDPATGLWSMQAAWQCIRAEANRSLRLGRPLDVWVGTASDRTMLDERGRELVFDLPAGAMGVRLDETNVCVLSCAGTGTLPASVRGDLQWRSTSLEPGEDAAESAREFIATPNLEPADG